MSYFLPNLNLGTSLWIYLRSIMWNSYSYDEIITKWNYWLIHLIQLSIEYTNNFINDNPLGQPTKHSIFMKHIRARKVPSHTLNLWQFMSLGSPKLSVSPLIKPPNYLFPRIWERLPKMQAIQHNLQQALGINICSKKKKENKNKHFLLCILLRFLLHVSTVVSLYYLDLVTKLVRNQPPIFCIWTFKS